MARLKRDNSSWRAHGLYKKYQEPRVVDNTTKRPAKKDTNRWCRGKVGKEHDWHRFQQKRYNWELDEYVSPYIEIKCMECRKEKYIKTAKSAVYPLHLWIDRDSQGYEVVQVKVNGKILPIDWKNFNKGKYWCNDCGYWH